MKITTGRELKEFRKEKGWDECQTAKALGCSTKDIINAEKNPKRKLTRNMQGVLDFYTTFMDACRIYNEDRPSLWIRIKRWIRIY